MIIEFDNDYSIVVHLGVDGNWNFKKGNVLFKTDKGNIYIDNAKSFGYIKIMQTNDIKLNVGEDINNLNFNSFEKLFKRRRKKIYSLLTDQKIISGIGNYIACEALYDADISPHIPANKLNKNEVNNLFNSINKIYQDMLNVKQKNLKNILDVIAQYKNRNPKIYEQEGAIIDKINGRKVYKKNK
jgi:formamidopyrimidine-DNA glycosylase